MAETLAHTRVKPGGNRSVMTKLSNEVNDLLEVEPINKQRMDFIAASLNGKLNLVKTFDEEIIENCAVDEIKAEIQESDEINSRVMDLLRLINEATTPKDNNAQEFRLPQSTNVSETTSFGSKADETAPSGFQQSTTPSGSSGTSTLASELQLLESSTSGGIQSCSISISIIQLLSLELCNHQLVLLKATVLNHLLTLARMTNLMSSQPKAKLPKLALPKLQGEVTQW